MKRIIVVLLLGCGLFFVADAVQEAEAQSCRPKTVKGSFKHTIRGALHLSKKACRTAEQKAKSSCKNKGKLLSFVVTKRKRRKRLGKGSQCTVSYACRVTPFGCGRKKTIKGSFKHTIRGALHLSKKACRTAEQKAKSSCKNKGKLLSFVVTKRKRRKRLGKGSQCTVSYTCKILQ